MAPLKLLDPALVFLTGGQILRYDMASVKRKIRAKSRFFSVIPYLLVEQGRGLAGALVVDLEEQ